MTVSRAVNTMGQGVAVPLPKFLSDHLTLNPTKGKGRLCGFSDLPKGLNSYNFFICQLVTGPPSIISVKGSIIQVFHDYILFYKFLTKLVGNYLVSSRHVPTCSGGPE